MVAKGFLGVGVGTGATSVLQNGIKAGDGTELCGSTAGKGSWTGWRSGTLQSQMQSPVYGPGQSLSKCYSGWLIQACGASGVVVKAPFPPVPGAQRCEIQPSE